MYPSVVTGHLQHYGGCENLVTLIVVHLMMEGMMPLN